MGYTYESRVVTTKLIGKQSLRKSKTMRIRVVNGASLAENWGWMPWQVTVACARERAWRQPRDWACTRVRQCACSCSAKLYTCARGGVRADARWSVYMCAAVSRAGQVCGEACRCAAERTYTSITYTQCSTRVHRHTARSCIATM